MTTVTGTQSDLFAWARELERENTRIAEINARRFVQGGWGYGYATLGMVLRLFVGLLHLFFGICWFLLGLILRWAADHRQLV